MSEENVDKTKPAVDESKPASGETKQPSDESKPAVSEADKALTDKVASLEASLAAKTNELTEAKKMLDAQAADIASLKTAGDEAVKAYRKLAVSSNPLFTEDVITGATIAEVDGAMARVTELAGRVRSRIEAEIKAISVPNGAPERSGPDLSTLSPREKIKLGLSEDKK